MAILRRKRADGPLEVVHGPGADPNARSITAAAMPLAGPAVKLADRARKFKSNQDWQREGWYYFDAIGELRSPLVWIAQAVSQADIHATELDLETGKPTGPTDNATANRVAAQVLGGASKWGGLLRRMALCWQVPGEYFVVVRPRGTVAGVALPDEWLVISPSKIKSKGQGESAAWEFTHPDTGIPMELDAKSLLFRVWCPHPDDPVQADSAIRPALPICREVEKSTMTIAAQLDSRLATAGVWLLADETDVPKGDHETSALALLDQLLDVSELGIKDPGTPSAVVPIAFNAPGELIASGGALAHVYPTTPFIERLDELRLQALARLAMTLDMPRDVAAGTQGDSNHWTAWQVEESTYKIFIEPMLREFGDAITERWFRPALVVAGLSPEEARRYELGWDTTKIVARPDDRESLESAWDKVLISDKFYLTENGYPLDAMPSEEERTRRVLERMVTTAPTLLSDPAVAAALGISVTVDPAAAGVAGASAGEIEGGETPSGADERALPSSQTEQPEEGPPEGLVASAEVLVRQALDRAGGRLLTNQNRGQFKDVPRHELYRHIRPSSLAGMVEVKFADGVAATFGRDPETLRRALEGYTAYALSTGREMSRDDLREWLR